MAVLVRTNARTTEFEEAFHDAAIPFQGASLLARDAARQLLKALRGRRGPAGEVVRELAVRQGLLAEVPDKLGEREQTRQADLARLVRLAEEFGGEVEEFVESLHERFGESAGRGVHLLTLHRAKGLEWEAVFLPHVEEGELPIRRGDVEEERRLFYVGLTRAKRHLLVTWDGKPSRFLGELGVRAAAPPPRKRRRPRLPQTPAVQALKEWRLARAREDEVRPTSSSTTGRWRSSSRGRRGRSPSWRRCRESARRSSSATGPSCSPGSPTSPPEGSKHRDARLSQCRR